MDPVVPCIPCIPCAPLVLVFTTPPSNTKNVVTDSSLVGDGKCNSPNEPVEVDEPLIFAFAPVEITFPPNVAF